MSVVIQMHEDFSKNANQCKAGETPCYICGKPCRSSQYMIHVHGGGVLAVTEDEAELMRENADLGFHPIGSSCLKKHPELLPYVHRQKRAAKA